MTKKKTILYIAMSLDGYIAREDGSVDWLEEVAGEGDNGYGKFYEGIGSIIMGRATYDICLGLSDTWMYAGKPCYVYSRTARPSEGLVEFTSEPPEQLIERLRQTSQGHIWLEGGGEIVRLFLERDLIDEMQIAIIPTVLGQGIPLFPAGTKSVSFRLAATETYGDIAIMTYNRAQ
ncbi:dihydrofolate reductase family protein [Paenibacillus methanolicus]|uniref:Dihydrofolate reductase n=1 Tax=Paenibacillus methanolicus TaxID=582686 RepID=A0A5S5CLB6_9BACL|nr:dihydrofolate reductase family protein [Paenibacillus methanolicus]TYP79657.1 dihydrofolate reductase [Paenibacillus methanolicus]